jgi:hypothetical protein
MKQITLQANGAAPVGRSARCLGHVVFCWALYGYAMALVWWALPREPLAEAAAWLVALVGGFALAGRTLEA